MSDHRLTRREWLLAVAAAAAAGPAARGDDAGAIPVAGDAGPGLKRFDAVLLAQLRKHRFPAASLSLAKGGRLVLARAYGFADLKAHAPARPDMLFGIGSVSKSVTAAAVLKLADAGKVRLDDRAFDVLQDLRPPDGATADPRTRDVTVRMLLNHTSGFDTTSHPAQAAHAFGVKKDDVTADQLIRFRLGKPLAYAPGTEARYSNFGYVVLGQIVERAAGQPYPDFVLQRVLGPMGVKKAEYGTRSEKYPPDWVRRYGPGGEELEPLRPVAAGAAGIWVTSSVDLVRFLTALDGVRGPRFLSPRADRQLLAPPPPPVKPRQDGSHFGLGWDTVTPGPRGVAYSKNGGLPGLRAFVGRMPGEVDWAFVATDVSNDKGENADAARAIREEIERTPAWPDVDYFQR